MKNLKWSFFTDITFWWIYVHCTVKVHCRKTSVVWKIGKKRFLSIVGFEIFNKNRRRKAHCRKKMKNILLLMKESITNRILKLEFLWISQLIENFIYFTYFEQCEPVTLFRWLQGQQKRGCIWSLSKIIQTILLNQPSPLLQSSQGRQLNRFLLEIKPLAAFYPYRRRIKTEEKAKVVASVWRE